MIMGTKVGQKHVQEQIEAFGTFDHHPDNVKKADRLKLNLYFDPMRRSSDLLDLDVAITTQRGALSSILADRIPLDDDATIKRAYCYYKLKYNENTRILEGFELNEKKVAKKKREAGFFANTTLKIKADPILAQHHYKLRDEQEKYFSMMKGIMGADRQRNWSESGKTGRLFILFVAQILGCYLGNVRKSKLNDKFSSIPDVLGEMRPIRYIEHPNTKAFITPFVGQQVDICEAFGFDIPEGYAPEYVVRKTNKGKRGRPRKNKLVVKE